MNWFMLAASMFAMIACFQLTDNFWKALFSGVLLNFAFWCVRWSVIMEM